MFSFDKTTRLFSKHSTLAYQTSYPQAEASPLLFTLDYSITGGRPVLFTTIHDYNQDGTKTDWYWFGLANRRYTSEDYCIGEYDPEAVTIAVDEWYNKLLPTVVPVIDTFMTFTEGVPEYREKIQTECKPKPDEWEGIGEGEEDPLDQAFLAAVSEDTTHYICELRPCSPGEAMMRIEKSKATVEISDESVDCGDTVVQLQLVTIK